jgi:hypothetical protein
MACDPRHRALIFRSGTRPGTPRRVGRAVNAALRYSPPVQTEQQSFSLSRLFLPRMPRNNRPARTETVAGERVVWVLKDKVPEAVRITTGASDGKMTEGHGDIALMLADHFSKASENTWLRSSPWKT